MTQTKGQKSAHAGSSPAILYDASVSRDASEWYGTMSVTNLRNNDGSVVRIKQFLGVIFRSPAQVSATDFNGSTNPWAEITAEVANEQIDSSSFVVTAKLSIAKGFTFSSGDTFSWGINGNLTKDPEAWAQSFVFAVDRIPDTSGTVNVDCANAPESALSSYQQCLTLTQGQKASAVSVPLGKTTSFGIDFGTYIITADDLAISDHTVVAAAQVSPSTITVTGGEATDIKVTYGTANNYSAIGVTIGGISGLESEQFHVTVVDDSGTPLADFSSPGSKTTSLRRLPASGTVDINVDQLAVNNVQYSFDTQTLDLSAKLFQVSLTEDSIKTNPVDTTGFVQLPIVVSTNLSIGSTISVRLTSSAQTYMQIVEAKAGTTPFSVPIVPDTYSVTTSNFLENGTVYFVKADPSLAVAADGSTTLQLTLNQGASLNVRGFPKFLSFGGYADLTPSNQKDFVAARASSLFKYAGIDGAGDSNTWLASDSSTTQTIACARAVEAQLGDGNPVLPVMVSYTCNLSGGDATTKLQDTDGLAHSFGNYILSLNIANANIDNNHPVPAGYVVNPDFIGTCQQSSLSPDYSMPVVDPLQKALDFRKVDATIPSSITDTLRGYVQAVNWLTTTVAPAVTFGWQVNIWGVGASEWVYAGEDEPVTMGQKTADYCNSLGVFDGHSPPDFLAVDRYEADDFTARSYYNGYCYGPHDWSRFFDFCSALGEKLARPIMPWQIPSSRAPLTTDLVNDDFDSQHWGTGGSYLLGDQGIGSDYDNVNSKVLSLSFGRGFATMGSRGKDTFTCGGPFDWTNPAYKDFLLRGIFTVLLGGGITTGISSTIGNSDSWVRDKLNQYMEDPIPIK
ncbi:hypothetical protein TOPH_03220 [Tolypocladium ophioglossoides CBS 100239]|uniref:Uncharacterized protein n=1 Tax=Tolypocladium ophioglossoides (strain CBS 100239) TaxID=1163406 RepID=A0A0L0NE02_TOLOC|nr:hypothetical protein TOPH_03220 [Tolypocladium ophioglossoides CBS 100239]